MSGSDKKVGVVGLSLFDLRRRGKVGKLSMVGTSGSKFPALSMICPMNGLCIL
jgi:D-galacturonate reductase